MARRVNTNFLNSDKEMFSLLKQKEVLNDDSSRIIKKALKKIIEEQLSEKQKEYIVLYYFKELDMATIAEMCEVNISTVSRTINRARQNIFKYMKYYFL